MRLCCAKGPTKRLPKTLQVAFFIQHQPRMAQNRKTQTLHSSAPLVEHSSCHPWPQAVPRQAAMHLHTATMFRIGGAGQGSPKCHGVPLLMVHAPASFGAAGDGMNEAGSSSSVSQSSTMPLSPSPSSLWSCCCGCLWRCWCWC